MDRNRGNGLICHSRNSRWFKRGSACSLDEDSMIIITYGFGGWCENCDETHDHPLHNIVEIRETPDEETTMES